MLAKRHCTQLQVAAPSDRQSYCEITIADVLDMVSCRLGTNGITNGNLYCTVTWTLLPGVLQGLSVDVQVMRVIGVVAEAATVKDDGLIPGKPRLWTYV